MYKDGRGVLKDYNIATEWFRKAAEQEDSHAQVYLGRMYREDDGVLQDNNIAFTSFQKAVEKGNVFAQYNLGVLYHTLGIFSYSITRG
jgi:uncharacterized protein